MAEETHYYVPQKKTPSPCLKFWKKIKEPFKWMKVMKYWESKINKLWQSENPTKITLHHYPSNVIDHISLCHQTFGWP